MNNRYKVEGEIILHYLLGEKPSTNLVQMYCIAVEKKFNKPKIIKFCKIARIFPSILYLIDPVFKPKTEIMEAFKIRLESALVILDASDKGADLFYNIQYENRFGLFLKLIVRLFIEVIIFPFRLVSFKGIIYYE